jgi:IS5 family transposase
MKPRKSPHKNRQKDLFLVELMQIIDPGNCLAKLTKVVDWDRFEEVFGLTFCEDNGLISISTRLLVVLHYLKYTHNLSDEDVVAGWVENPCWQNF